MYADTDIKALRPMEEVLRPDDGLVSVWHDVSSRALQRSLRRYLPMTVRFACCCVLGWVSGLLCERQHGSIARCGLHARALANLQSQGLPLSLHHPLLHQMSNGWIAAAPRHPSLLWLVDRIRETTGVKFYENHQIDTLARTG